MTDNQILSTISQSRTLRRRFHNLEKPERRKVLDIAQGSDEEKCLLKAIRKVKRLQKV